MEQQDPVYKQLVREIESYIQRHQLKPGDRLPSTKTLCEMFGVSHITVNAAFKHLQHLGVVEGRRRSGVFVADRAHKSTFGARQQQTLGLLIPYGNHPFEADIIRGVMETARSADFQVIVSNNNNDAAMEREQLRSLAASTAGLLVMPILHSPNYAAFAELVDRGIPLIFIDRYVAGIKTPVVATNNEAGGYQITRHLLENNFHRIYVLMTGGATSTLERIDGYRRALREFGKTFDARLVRTASRQMDAMLYDLTRQLVQGELTQQDKSRLAGYCLMSEILSERPQTPFAVFSVTDDMANSAYLSLQEKGINVPADVALAGYDDTQYYLIGGPTLTTIRQQPHSMGAEAVKVLIQQLHRQTKSTSGKRLSPELIVRGSTTAPTRLKKTELVNN